MYLTWKDMQNILSNKWITKYYNIDPVYLKICIVCIYLYIYMWKIRVLEVYKSNINQIMLILVIKRKFHFVFLYFSNHGLTEFLKAQNDLCNMPVSI